MKKFIYFVTGLPHSGTSIIQKTIGDQADYYVEYTSTKNVAENTGFGAELQKKIHLNSVEDYWKNGSKVTKLPCVDIYFNDIFRKINDCVNEPDLCFIFTARNPIEWCSSYLMRRVNQSDLKQHIDVKCRNKHVYHSIYHSIDNKKEMFTYNKKLLIKHLKKVHDAYHENINTIINSKPKAKIVRVNLLDFSKNPKKFLKTIGFKEIIICGEDRDDKKYIKTLKQHEKKRALQIAQRPSQNMIVNKFDFHPTLQDYLQEVFI